MNVIGAVVISAALGSLASRLAPPALPCGAIAGTRTTVPPVTRLALGTKQIKFESSTFADVAGVASAPVTQRGDASEFEMSACFTLSDARQRLWLTSSELGGRRFIDGAVAAFLPEHAHATTDCPELPKSLRPVHFDKGIWLGASVDSLDRLFGRSGARPDGWRSYVHLRKEGEYDVQSTLYVRVSDHRVVALLARHTTTN